MMKPMPCYLILHLGADGDWITETFYRVELEVSWQRYFELKWQGEPVVRFSLDALPITANLRG